MPPSTNHYLSWRAIPTNKFRKVQGKSERVWIPQSFDSVDYKSFKKEFKPYLEKLVKEHDWNIEDTKIKHYYLDITMYFDRIDKDSSNYFKCPCDVGNQIIYEDDKTIITRVKRVYYTYNKNIPPHFEYELFPVEYIGIWNNEEEYLQFLDRCKYCKNYKDGKCKRLNDFLAYKITEDFDVDSRQCLGYKESKTKK